jgi:hypothetical protein
MARGGKQVGGDWDGRAGEQIVIRAGGPGTMSGLFSNDMNGQQPPKYGGNGGGSGGGSPGEWDSRGSRKAGGDQRGPSGLMGLISNSHDRNPRPR